MEGKSAAVAAHSVTIDDCKKNFGHRHRERRQLFAVADSVELPGRANNGERQRAQNCSLFKGQRRLFGDGHGDGHKVLGKGHKARAAPL